MSECSECSECSELLNLSFFFMDCVGVASPLLPVLAGTWRKEWISDWTCALMDPLFGNALCSTRGLKLPSLSDSQAATCGLGWDRKSTVRKQLLACSLKETWENCCL